MRSSRGLIWKSGRSGTLQFLSPLRTVHDSFPSYGSSISKVKPCGATRLSSLTDAEIYSNFITYFLDYCDRKTFWFYPSCPEVLLMFRVKRICIIFDFDVPLDMYAVSLDEFVNSRVAVFIFDNR